MTKLEYFTSIYGWMQLSMVEVGLLNKDGRPFKKRKLTQTEQDAIYLYQWVGDHLKDVKKPELERMGKVTDKNVKLLPNDHSNINNFLLGIMLLRLYIDDEGTNFEHILLGGKIRRVVDLADKAVSEDEFSVDVKRATHRTAYNLYRRYTGYPMLSDEAFDNKYKRIKR